METRVGIFLLFGIGIICTLILFFGEVKDVFKPTYSLTVKFPNASGLLKGSDVFLSGAHHRQGHHRSLCRFRTRRKSRST